MEAKAQNRLHRLLRSMDSHIEDVRRCGYADTEFLLKLVKLDLKMKLYGISESELRDFSRMLEETCEFIGVSTSQVIDARLRFNSTGRRQEGGGK